ncbi:MAG TPA: class I SAM-dependent methyltransferase [Jatrophihabitans sp.]|jgi:SAM-dependent methyltransferase
MTDVGNPWQVRSFEELYASVGSDLARVPWARLAPQPMLLDWLDSRNEPNGTALVIACGLGDDAEELSRRGYQVTAFDVSETAIGWCRQRFPSSKVEYSVHNLFALPEAWSGQFDFVLEVNTVQSLPPSDHENAIDAIANTVAANGLLRVKCLGREADQQTPTRPYPLSRAEIARYGERGLTEIEFVEQATEGDRFWWLTYRRDG